MSKKPKTSKKKAASVPRGWKEIAQQKHITEYRLTKNGLRVLYVHIAGSPTVTTNIVYQIGSRHELPGQTGLAHMLEHMLFKPTTTKNAVTWKDLEEKGALMNATTWVDRTLYYFNLPSEYLDDMLAVEADRMRNTPFSKKEFLPERTNVLSEYQMYNSNPEMVLEWNIVGSAFQSHGYKHDTIGFREDIEAYTPETLKAFYDRFYWPNNATMIVAGDIPVSEILKKAAKHFGDIPGNFDPATAPVVTEPTQEGERRTTLIRNTPVRVMKIGFKAPEGPSRDWTALKLGLHFLANTETSPLYTALVEKGFATSVKGALYQTHDPFLALLTVYATEKASYEKIEEIIRDAFTTWSTTPLSKEKLAALQGELYAQELFARDGSFSIAEDLAEYVASGDWTRYFSAHEEIKNITAKEIQEALRRYCVWDHATIGTVEKPHESTS